MSRKQTVRLIRETLAGQDEAFSDLVKEYQDYAYGLAIGLLSDFDLAQDVVQESFICAYRNLGKLKDPERFGGWLRGIVRNMAYRAMRELERVRAMTDELGKAADWRHHEPTPEQIAERTEVQEMVHRALLRLNEKNREAVSLHYVNGFSYAEISDFLEVSEAAVQGRLQRARAKLRKELRMVKETFIEKTLPEGFSEEIRGLLEAVAASRQEHLQATERLAMIGDAAVDPLCEALGDSREAVRRTAALALCRIGNPRALRPILRVLYSNEGTVAELFRKGEVLSIPGLKDELIKIVGEGSDWIGLNHAILALSYATGDEETYGCILSIFRDRSKTNAHRIDALSALCSLKPEDALDLIVDALAEPVFRRHVWVWWLALRDGHLVPVETCLTGFSRDAKPATRAVAGKIVLMHGEPGRNTLATVLSKGSPDEQATAALALAEKGDSQAFGVLISELASGYSNTKWIRRVSRTIIHYYRERLSAWVDAEKPDTAGCPGLTWLIAQVRIANSEAAAEDVFYHGGPAAQAAAAKELAYKKGADFIPSLRQCLREGKPRKVAQEAFRQMYRFGNAAMPTVTEMLGSEMWTERKSAVCLLRRWGKLSSEQKARAEADPHIAVRHAAKWKNDRQAA